MEETLNLADVLISTGLVIQLQLRQLDVLDANQSHSKGGGASGGTL